MRIAINWSKQGREALILLAIGTFLAIINPYGATSSLPIWQSWLYWTGLVVYGSIVGTLVYRSIMKWLGSWPAWLVFLIIVSVCAVMVTPVLIGLEYVMGGRVPLRELPAVYGMVWVISAAMTGVGYVTQSMGMGENKDGDGSEGADGFSGFMSRLPLPYRNADLYALSSEDHYLRVHTSAGEHMFLERLSTAMHQLEQARGLQTHRSWWVAEQGVQEVRSASGRLTIILKSGVEVPVSRTYGPEVRAAGWVG
ncbi:LytTR family DNA-binding domain-containing protein [Ponticaulis sp.]|uniref:LytTR family DNA-binding domain-containing protein n=1 Tax=Ponticaulis sp. TaxID=2020902 RepID=UPI000B720E7B|nr:LytTR family DNA-binding domain-containing protein [Ponticaulis sp.]MAI90709.1 hypothetical protein [Ponticaulis sp.]OUX99214.1 MAG: hypothetical protein CBB65_09735 [Hyphomonadaceae bacterium TMED5]